MFGAKLSRLLGFGQMLWLMVAPASADMLQKTVNLRFEAGVYCNISADRKEDAPDTRDGWVGIHDQPYNFVQFGDTAPDLPDMAIGIVIHLVSYRSGETLTVRQRRVEDAGRPESWKIIVAEGGRYWLGRYADPGKSLLVGHYQTEILRSGKVIFGYEFIVIPASRMPDFKPRCDLNIS